MAHFIDRNIWVLVTLIIGFSGAVIAGFAVAMFFQKNDDFTSVQREYIDGVATGSRYMQVKNEIERQPNSAPEDSLLRHPEQRCIRDFYPGRNVTLAGCLDAVDGDTWHMP